MRRGVLLIAVLVVSGFAIDALADATMSRETPVDPSSHLEVVIEARVVREPNMSLHDVLYALVTTCRTQVDARADDAGLVEIDDDRFRIVITPAVNESDRRQLHGCIEDARVQHLQAEVLSMRQLGG